MYYRIAKLIKTRVITYKTLGIKGMNDPHPHCPTEIFLIHGFPHSECRCCLAAPRGWGSDWGCWRRARGWGAAPPALQVLQGGVDPRLPRPQAMLLRVWLLQDQGRYA